MNFTNDYPRLFQFFAGYFPDADLDDLTDEEVVRNYNSDCNNSERSKTELQQLKADLTRLMANIGHYWKEVGEEANRYFTGPDEARVWLDLIKTELEKE